MSSIEWRNSGMGKWEMFEILYGIGQSMPSEAFLIDTAFIIICTHFIRLHSLSSVRHLDFGITIASTPTKTHLSKTNHVQFGQHTVALVSLSFIVFMQNAKRACTVQTPSCNSLRGHYWHRTASYVSQTNIIKIKPLQQFVQIHRSFRRHSHRTT